MAAAGLVRVVAPCDGLCFPPPGAGRWPRSSGLARGAIECPGPMERILTSSAEIAHWRASDQRRSRRERYLMLALLVGVVLITWAEIRLSRLPGDLPLANHLLFFSLININLLLALVLAFLVI